MKHFAIVIAPSPAMADRRLAGISVAGRLAHQFAAAGIADIWIVLPAAGSLASATHEDIDRLTSSSRVRFLLEPELGPALAAADRSRGMVTTTGQLLDAGDIRRFAAGRAQALVAGDAPVLWRIGAAPDLASPEPGSRDCMQAHGAISIDREAPAKVLRTAGKSGDGFVSRWINRPISRRISGLLLRFPGVRPVHATIATAVVSTAMFIAFLTGTSNGMLVGALLFQAASILDGVDGEIARLTMRSSARGAALDAAIDVATNLLFVLGLTFNLYWQGNDIAPYLGLWSLAAMALGLWLIGKKTVDQGEPLGFDLLKRAGAAGWGESALWRAVVAFFTLATGRDCFAFVFAILIWIGLPMVGLYTCAVIVFCWISFVLATFFAGRNARPSALAARQGVRG